MCIRNFPYALSLVFGKMPHIVGFVLSFGAIGLCIVTVIGKQPHIVFILADDLGFNDVGYHNRHIYTPNIDLLAKAGVKLENYYVQPLCTPSRSQLLTGRYQIHTGLQHNTIFQPQKLCLPLDEVTLPQKLKEVGYKTHMIGKWNLGFYRKECLPMNRGFDTHYGFYGPVEDYYTKEANGHFPGWNHSSDLHGFDFRDNEEPAWSANGTYSTYLYADRAKKVISEHDRSKPMFLFLSFRSVHFPLQAPQKYIDIYWNVRNTRRRIYSAKVTAMDDTVGTVIQTLHDHGMMDDTLIVFSTDNGGLVPAGASNWPFRGGARTLWEGGIKAVGFVHGYGVKQSGRTSRGLFHISDWFPSLLHIAGGNSSGTKPLDGLDIWNAIANPSVPSPRTEILHNIDPLYARVVGGPSKLIPYPNKQGINTTEGHAALRIGKWKLLTGDPGSDFWEPQHMSNQDQFQEVPCLTKPSNGTNCVLDFTSVRLYNIQKDPTELVNVANNFPIIVDQMLARLAEYNATAVPVNYPGPDINSDPALRGGVWGPWVD